MEEAYYRRTALYPKRTLRNLVFRIDIVMLSALKGDAVVGIYSAAYNPLLAIAGIISGTIVAAIYPVMSRLFVASRDALDHTTVLVSRYMAMIGLPIAMGCFVLASKFVELFYEGQFSASAIAFQILALFIPIRLVSSVTGTLLTSINKQGLRTISVGLSALLNIFLNALMIPYLSYVGASIATVLSEVFLYFVFLHFISRYYKRLLLYSHYTKPIIASILMGLFIFYFKNMNLLILIPCAVMLYLLALLLLKAFTDEDKKIFSLIMGRRR